LLSFSFNRPFFNGLVVRRFVPSFQCLNAVEFVAGFVGDGMVGAENFGNQPEGLCRCVCQAGDALIDRVVSLVSCWVGGVFDLGEPVLFLEELTHLAYWGGRFLCSLPGGFVRSLWWSGS
jgi:hypothetical protein